MSTTPSQRLWKICTPLAAGAAAIALPAAAAAQGPVDRPFALKQDAEVVAAITAACAGCDWSAAGREAVVLKLTLDEAYSQHLVLVRGREASTYRVMLGTLGAGGHRLRIERDAARSARGAGDATVERIEIVPFGREAPEHAWLSRAPVLRARPGSVERFSDAPLLMYVEKDVTGEQGTAYRYQYTVVFSHEDGGTSTDRLMATWGRTTDIEFVYGIASPVKGAPAREEIQAAGHKWIPFDGRREGSHPVLWVATDNNMVAASGPEEAIRFAPAPESIALDGVSREAAMDGQAWTYAVASAELWREGRIEPDAIAGSGRIPDPRRYATIEACGDVRDATLAFDVGVRRGSGLAWFATDRAEAAFRIGRGGCFRGAAPLPAGTSPADIVALRVRAYTRPPRNGEAALPRGTGRVTLRRINRVFMLDDGFVPSPSPIRWEGTLEVPTDAAPVTVTAAPPR
jgi:hypothetical protein